MAGEWREDFKPDLQPRFFSHLLNRIDVYNRVLRELPLSPSVRIMLDLRSMAASISGNLALEGISAQAPALELLLLSPPSDGAAGVERKAARMAEAIAFIKGNGPLPRVRLAEQTLFRLRELTGAAVDDGGVSPAEYRKTNMDSRGGSPDAEKVPVHMDGFFDFINSEAALILHPAVRAALGHYYIVSIAPFVKGNKITARAVEAYFLFNGGFGSAGLCGLSDFYARRAEEYEDSLRIARTNEGGLRDFVVFALQGFEDELESRYLRMVNIYQPDAYRAYLDDLCRSGVITERVRDVAGEICRLAEGLDAGIFRRRETPWLTRAYRGLSDRSVRSDLTIMRKYGLVREAEERIFANLRPLEAPY